MDPKPDIVIRNGQIVDGSGGKTFVSDLAITDGLITQIGGFIPQGKEEIDALDRVVTPGFIDIHTHYDAQVTWANRIDPSSWNGVTTAMIGNCGVGFAPCKPNQRNQLVELMEGVEDIPEPVLTEGLPWTWETFDEYLDTIDAKNYDLDILTQVPHAALRVYVMGDRGVNRDAATSKDREDMAQLAANAIGSGAFGFSTSRTINHRTVAGEYTPTLGAPEEELIEISRAVGKTGKGWLQVISDFDNPQQEMLLLNNMVDVSGRPMTITILQRNDRPELWRETMKDISRAHKDGKNIFGQVLTRPTGVMLSFELSLNPFMACDAWKSIEKLPHDQKILHLNCPSFRKRMLTEPQGEHIMRSRILNWASIFPLNDPPDYEPPPECSIASQASAKGVSPEELAYDFLLKDKGKGILYRPLSNYSYGNLDSVADMLENPGTIIGLGDGGAHVGILSDASAITYMLTHWTRDRTRGRKFSLPWAIKRLTSDNANVLGLNDRGLLRVGKKADINIVNYHELRINYPEVRYDLPAGGRRMVQTIDGYDATILSGKIVRYMGQSTLNLPGRLVRST